MGRNLLPTLYLEFQRNISAITFVFVLTSYCLVHSCTVASKFNGKANIDSNLLGTSQKFSTYFCSYMNNTFLYRNPVQEPHPQNLKLVAYYNIFFSNYSMRRCITRKRQTSKLFILLYYHITVYDR